MFKTHGVTKFDEREVNDACRTHSRVVANVENKIGDHSLRKALREFLEEGRHALLASERGRTSLDIRIGLTVQNNTVYTGQFDLRTNCKEGFGVQIWPDGSKYVGLWKEGKAFGFGRFILADGDAYQGEWLEGKAHGRGDYFYADGARYQGDWIEDKQQGFGSECWPDGSRYQGEYRDGKKNGEGLFTWADGATYYGQWSNNKMHGMGVFKLPDGRTYEGQY